LFLALGLLMCSFGETRKCQAQQKNSSKNFPAGLPLVVYFSHSLP
jgi:hypothetical protein